MTSKSEKELVYGPGGNGAEPVEGQELLPALDDMTPREIVVELDKYIVGQNAAKRAVAVALRNRVRRHLLRRPAPRKARLPRSANRRSAHAKSFAFSSAKASWTSA